MILSRSISDVRVVIVTGASGFLGWTVCRRLSEEAGIEVIGVSRRHPDPPHPYVAETLDLTEEGAVEGLVRRWRPDSLIHLAAARDPNWCELNPDASEAINAVVPERLSSVADRDGIRLIHVSSDLVFDGESGAPYSESDRVAPLSVYGMHKARAECVVLERCPDALVCRLPLLFGPASPLSGSFVQGMIAAIEQGRTVQAFVDEWRTPVSSWDVADFFAMHLDAGVSGLLHLGGAERLSRYEFALRWAEVSGVDGDRVVACSSADVPMAAARSRDVSLDSSRARPLGYSPGCLVESLRRLSRVCGQRERQL